MTTKREHELDVTVELFLTRYSDTGTAGVTAAEFGLTWPAMANAIERRPWAMREYAMLRDGHYTASLMRCGTDCMNGCGPVIVGRKCPECGKIRSQIRRRPPPQSGVPEEAIPSPAGEGRRLVYAGQIKGGKGTQYQRSKG